MSESEPHPPRRPYDPPDGDTYQITPLDPTPPDERYDKPIVPEVIIEEAIAPKAEKPPQRFQFTIRDLLLLTTGVAVWLSAMYSLHLNWAIAAGLMGVATLVSLVILTVFEPEKPAVRLAWWCILGLYLLTCFCAVVAS